MPLSPGQILNNRYRIVKLLSQGGMGAVYRAWDINLDMAVAIKENLDTSPEDQKQFQREAHILAHLSHPNLPRVGDHFFIPGQGQYLVMDFVEGEDLEQMLTRTAGPLPEEKVLSWIMQICDALAYLHTQTPPIIHRDIKPANIKVTLQGRAMLVDFGIAKVYDPQLKTTMGARAVTPGYSPIEQYGQGTTDAQSDVYALGATLYHLLTGFQPPASVDIVAKIFSPHRSPRLVNSAITPWISSVIDKAMQLEKKDRWSSIIDFKAAFTPPPSSCQPHLPTSSVGPHSTVVTSEHQASLPWQSAVPVIQRYFPWRWIGLVSGFMLVMIFGLAVIIFYFFPFIFKSPKPLSTTRAIELIPSDTALSLPSITYALPAPITKAPFIPTTEAPSIPTTEAPFIPTSPLSDFTDEHGIQMKLIPAGEFEMGSESGDSDEKPTHTVYLDDFYIDVHEVTNTSYRACDSVEVCQRPISSGSSTSSNYYFDSHYADYPVIYITWEMAEAYCKWRSGSLPTEAQWEKAARGGMKGMDYPWGNDEPVCDEERGNGANFWDCQTSSTKQVGSYSPNGYDLYDMAGNVWEWILDWYSSIFYSRQIAFNNPFGPTNGDDHLVRGGSWRSGSNSLRVADRFLFDSKYTNSIGIRCVRYP